MKVTIESSKAFAKSAALPVVEDFGLESVDEFAIPDFSKPDLAVTVGSQIASFSAAVEPDLREKISNGFLFAQQAANKRLEDAPEASSFVWYSMYVHVLNQIGWTTEADGTLENEIKGTSAQVQNEIISIINAALGPAIASSSMLVKVLEGLSNMDKNSPWITLFNRESQRATANQFQLSHIDKVDGVPRIALVNFELAAQKSITQVLFFKLDTDEATLQHSERKISVNEPIFSEVAPLIAERLADRSKKFVMEIDI